MVPIQSKKQHEICDISGVYICLYHPKSKQKIAQGSHFNACNYAGLVCEGCWHLSKIITEKTASEKRTIYYEKLTKKYLRRGQDNKIKRDLKAPKFNKWDSYSW
ncbi:MAG TPA: hypothetical protein PLI68_03595 [Bacteroidia bacterium]|nr:hypothetical protein [Bacteroidia bacterium]HRH08633.1 hypothetical protein [Bacteroidia bacterium]HRH62388.1 hypothetical protein [Bacteroidia bacterium]